MTTLMTRNPSRSVTKVGDGTWVRTDGDNAMIYFANLDVAEASDLLESNTPNVTLIAVTTGRGGDVTTQRLTRPLVTTIGNDCTAFALFGAFPDAVITALGSNLTKDDDSHYQISEQFIKVIEFEEGSWRGSTFWIPVSASQFIDLVRTFNTMQALRPDLGVDSLISR